MKNVVVCKNCSSENPFYGLICIKCKSYLRERVYNIDLWKTISLLVESPSAAFKNIIFSEHKNFLVLVLILVSGKILLNGIFMNIFFSKGNISIPGYLEIYIISLVFLVTMLLLFAGLLTIVTGITGIKTKFLDNFSIITYSFVPLAFGFIILFPIELVLFGEYLFYYAPSPFHLKETIAYSLLVIELSLLLWSLFLTFTALKVETKNTIFAAIFALSVHLIFNLTLYFTGALFYK